MATDGRGRGPASRGGLACGARQITYVALLLLRKVLCPRAGLCSMPGIWGPSSRGGRGHAWCQCRLRAGQWCSLAVHSGLAEREQCLSMPTDRRSRWIRENLVRGQQARVTRAQALHVFVPDITSVNEHLLRDIGYSHP